MLNNDKIPGSDSNNSVRIGEVVVWKQMSKGGVKHMYAHFI